MRVLVVEDDLHLAEILTEALSDCAYSVDVVKDGESAWNWISSLSYDLIVLDITLPKLDGISLCQRLRTSTNNTTTPVLMLTARDTIADKILGLDAGADDYMVKPFDLEELLARIRALLRRGTINTPALITWGKLQIDPGTHDVTYADELVQLTPKEYSDPK